MLTNLNWLNSGSIYPPKSERARLNQYEQNEKLFDSEHAAAFETLFKSYAQKLHKKSLADVTTIINYQQLLSKKTADFVCGEPPEMETEQDTDELEKVLEMQRFNAKLYEAIIDVSRYGNAILKHNGDKLTAVSPKYWFPIVDETDLKSITSHVIAYPTTPDVNGKPTRLYVEIHTVGQIKTLRLSLDDGKIGGAVEEPTEISTGLDDFAVQVLTNVTHSSSVYGIDDYKPINSIVARLIWRLHCVDSILDKHSEPTMTGPSTALKYDSRTGMSYFDLGTFLTRDDNNDPDLKYVTWDGNIESAFKEIELLIQQLYTLSEMGQAFMVGGGGGEANSGTALKLLMVAPRIKAARIVGLNNSTVKKIIHTLGAQNGITIDYDALTLHWKDGLPNDEKEQTEVLSLATGNKPIMSQYSALKRMGLTDAEVEEELEQIAAEQATSMPSILSAFSAAAGVTANEETDE